MKRFEFARATTVEEACAALSESCRPIAGGTDLLQRMKAGLVAPRALVGLKSVTGLDQVETRDGGLQIGALVTLANLADHPALADRTGARCLRQAIRESASPQLRNMATIGGNLLQKPRCWYYRNELTHCWLKGGTRCFAVRGENKYHAVFGRGGCQAVHASDPAVALVALGATVEVTGPEGARIIPLSKLYQIPQRESRSQDTLGVGELLTRVFVPAMDGAARSAYVKVSQRSAWDFALVSVAVWLSFAGHAVREARVVLGGVGPMPWTAEGAERVLAGGRVTPETVDRAAVAAAEGARPLAQNAYKLDIVQGAVRQALRGLA
jgi:xanthine dehydrogenase YagS FAD-binding subunit